MSLERVDVRAKVDHDIHAALMAICNHRGMTVAEFVEGLLVPEVRRIIAQSVSIVDSLPGKGQPGSAWDILEMTGRFKVQK